MTESMIPPLTGDIVVVRGGGDLATGVVQKLARAGLRVVVLETQNPTVIRHTVSLATAVVDGYSAVEDIVCYRAQPETLDDCWADGIVPILVDPTGAIIPKLNPCGVVDAIIAKRNLGTNRGMAPVTIALGPGFRAPEDVDCVVETMRGHNLGRLIFDGAALPNTGTPGLVGGKSAERVIHAPVAGVVKHVRGIGDIVDQGELVFTISGTPVHAPISGVIRGLIAEGMTIPKGLKSADIDPRTDTDCYTISDKARSLGGCVLEAYCYVKRSKGVVASPRPAAFLGGPSEALTAY